MRPKKILVVDDEPNNFDVIEGLLFSEGYHLDYASNGFNALKRLELEQPDLILLDVMMPQINGIEVCTRLKSNPNLSHIPVVMVTALNSKEDMARCLEAGADDFIGKPVAGIELRARVRSMLRIKEQYDALKATLQLREDMAHAIVHDLKNPLTSILLAADLLTHSPLTEQQQRKVRQITQDTEKLRSLTDDLLLMAKAEAGKLKLQLDAIDLNALASEVVSDFDAIAANKTITLVTKLPTQSPQLWLDRNLFYRVLGNLLANAIKFSPKNNQVTLEILPSNDERETTQIRIADRGRGVNPALRQSIFQKFEIGKVMENVPQTGIGLAFCQMVVEAHQGKIAIEDNYPQGAIFIISLACYQTDY